MLDGKRQIQGKNVEGYKTETFVKEMWKTYGHYKKDGPKGTISIGERKEAHIIEKNGGS